MLCSKSTVIQLVYVQVILTNISTLGTVLKVWFIQDSVYSGFGLGRFHYIWTFNQYKIPHTDRSD
jgi:hypothetical protein